MSHSIKQQWLDALRSGVFKQCYGALVLPVEEAGKFSAEYCALGVLGAFSGLYEIMYTLQQIWPITYGEKAEQIMLANDIDTLSFPAIAEMIESWPDDVVIDDVVIDDVVIDDVVIDDVVIEPVISSVTSKQKELTYV